MAKKAVIIGAGPAGLTAGLELLRRTEIVPVILEASEEIGGISRTIRYKGNRMDIGGHRFFSKSDRVMEWWVELMPPELAAQAGSESGAETLSHPVEIGYQGKRRVVTVPAHLHEESPLRGMGPLQHAAESSESRQNSMTNDTDELSRLVLQAVADDFEEIEMIVHDVTKWLGGVDGSTYRRQIEHALMKCIADKNVKAYETSDELQQFVATQADLQKISDHWFYITEQGKKQLRKFDELADADLVMLIRPRRSRIYYLRKFFDYPITLTATTLKNLGVVRMARVGTSYAFSRVHQIKPEKSLEDFLINRFGRELYLTFFKSYTEKVWGTPCQGISAEWGAQRIKGLSLTTAVKHFVKKMFRAASECGDLAQKGTDTSLIERFMYPKFGPGQLWEHVAELVQQKGGEIHKGWKVERLNFAEGGPLRVTSIEAVSQRGERRTFAGDYFFSTMPMRDLLRAMNTPIPANVLEVSDGLQYRDFITVGLLVDRLKVMEPDGGLLKDTWIYIQEPDVLLGRLQIFNNWSPYLVRDPTKVWIGLEYFCYETDDLWKKSDEEMKKFAIAEVVKIGILNAADVSDAHVVRVPKTYPAYFGTYNRFEELKTFTDGIENLFLVGRNGMHKYNNQDHSMLTAMHVVDGLAAGRVDKQALWEINTEQEYHEEKDKK
jgi:protoporphyrinogen oxidase